MTVERFLDVLFLSTVICFFGVLALVLYESTREEEEVVCECREWVNLDQDIKCFIKRDDRKYGQKGRENVE